MAVFRRAKVKEGRDPRRNHDDTRIAIIGAGCSGITAAYKLHERGYRNITLYEANDRIGGKVHSANIDGHVIEVGAVGSLQANRTVMEMARELGWLRLARVEDKITVALKADSGSTVKVLIDRYWGSATPLAVAHGLVRFWRVLWLSQFKDVFQIGFYNLHPDVVSLTMTEFARRQRFHSILDLFCASEYGCGYGPMDEIPAVYHLKMMKSLEKARFRRQISLGRDCGVYTFEGGYQALWERIISYLVDRGLVLCLGAPVTQVVRQTAEDNQVDVKVVANGQTRTYDRIFVTTSPDQTVKYIDATDEEEDLFGRVSYFNYHSVVFRAEGLDQNEWVAIRHNMKRNRHGHLFCYRHAAPASDLFVGYQFNESTTSDEELDELVRHDIAELGGAVSRIVVRNAWRYFPHLKLQDIDTDCYPRLNTLQGQQGTYYLGGLFAFESTEHCAQFAEFIVKQFHEHERRAPRDRAE
jgi:protoporphyrinogen oxidase